jgi:hypothetical protein
MSCCKNGTGFDNGSATDELAVVKQSNLVRVRLDCGSSSTNNSERVSAHIGKGKSVPNKQDACD